MASISGGKRLEEALADIARHLSGPGRKLRVGFLEKSKYPDGTPVGMVAAIQNYGAPRAGIPPRPFFSNMVRDESPLWPGGIAVQLAANNYDVDKTLEITGDVIVGQLKRAILDTWTPPLAPSTVARKGFDKPLIDSSLMYNSADKEVVAA